MSGRRVPTEKVVRIVVVAAVAVAVLVVVGTMAGIILGVPQIREIFMDAFRDLFGP